MRGASTAAGNHRELRLPHVGARARDVRDLRPVRRPARRLIRARVRSRAGAPRPPATGVIQMSLSALSSARGVGFVTYAIERPVGRPLWIAHRHVAGGEQSRLSRRDVHHPQPAELVVRVHDDRVVLLLDPLLLLRRRLLIGDEGDRLPVGRPGDRPHAALVLRQPLRLAAERRASGRSAACLRAPR